MFTGFALQCVLALCLLSAACAFVARPLSSWGGRQAEKQRQKLFVSLSAPVEELMVEDRADAATEYLGPPTPLRDLQVGEAYKPFEPLEITKVANDPPMFVIRNFLPFHACETLMNAADRSLRTAKGLTGSLEHRVGSSLAWIDGRAGNKEQHKTAAFMTQLATHLFLHEDLVENENTVNAEPLQVVKYDKAGSFDLHTDGCNRVVTVLTYLNGIAGTWFPFVGASDEQMQSMKLENNARLEDKSIGEDGLVIAGYEQQGLAESEHVVRVGPGDAVVFYNYETDPELGKIEAGRSLHCGLKALDTKWIATNWLGSSIL